MRLTNLDECNRELFYKQMGGKDTLVTVESAFNMLMALPTVNATEILDNLVEECERFKSQYKTFYFQDLLDISKKIKTQYENNDIDNEFFNFDKVIEIEKKKSYKQALEDFFNKCLEENIQFYLNPIDCMREVKEQLKK